MSQQIIVLGEAEDELIAAERWYEHQRPGLGREFRLAIDDAMARLSAAPLTASPLLSVPVALGARQVIVKRFPYSIIFVELETELWVVVFAHETAGPVIGVTG